MIIFQTFICNGVVLLLVLFFIGGYLIFSACYVRADKVMELRKLLNECSSTDGLIFEEKGKLLLPLDNLVPLHWLLYYTSSSYCLYYEIELKALTKRHSQRGALLSASTIKKSKQIYDMKIS
jgi:hypothetical protein